MKRTLTLILVLAFLVALFAGCAQGGTTTPPAADNTQQTESNTQTNTNTQSNSNTQTNSNTQSSSSSNANTETQSGTQTETAEPETTEPETTEPEEPGLPFAVDEFGIATEKYDWPLPLTTNEDEVLRYWFVVWTPDYLPEGGFGETALPMEAEARTGVKVEYVAAPTTSRAEAFSVMLAADDLCDICCNAVSYYPGTPVEMVEDEYFVNVYDYRDWMPNFFYEAKYRYPDDIDTYTNIFYYDDFVPSVYNMNIKGGEMIGGYVLRGDLMEQIGVDPDTITTWDAWHDVLVALKGINDQVEFPMWIAQTLEMNKYWQFQCFGSLTAIPTTNLPPLWLDENKQVQLGCTTEGDKKVMEIMSQWFSEGLINPDWMSYQIPADFGEQRHQGKVACMYDGAVNLPDARRLSVDPDAYWVPMQKPTLYEGQVFTVGNSRGRTGTGCCSFATKNVNLEVAMKWIDYRYSPSGADLYTYGPEGYIIETDANGEKHNTEWALNNPNGWALSWLAFIYSLDAFCDPGLADTNTKLFNDAADESRVAIRYWTDWLNAHYDASGLYPAGARLSSEQSEELSDVRNNVVTYIAENFSLYMDGSKPLSEWDAYVADLESIGLNKIKEIYQEAYSVFQERMENW